MLADKKASAGGSLMRLLNTPSLRENRRTYLKTTVIVGDPLQSLIGIVTRPYLQ